MVNKKELAKKIFANLFLYTILAFLYLPIIWLIVFSFTDTYSISNWNGFSLNAYINLFVGKYSGAIFKAIGNTMLIATIASFISVILGTFAAIGLHSMHNKKIKNAYNNLSQVPMVNSEIVTAVSLMLLFVILKTFVHVSFNTSMIVVILCHVTFCTPYVVLNIMPRLSSMDNKLYEAALDLGAKPHQALQKVVIPEIMPGIIMGFVTSFTLSIDDFVITKFNIDGFDTLSTFIYTMSGGKKPLPIEVRALSSIIFIVLLGLLVIINRANSKSKDKNKGVSK
ncbi:MAG: ABC transporter permease [Clostridia bacterium]